MINWGCRMIKQTIEVKTETFSDPKGLFLGPEETSNDNNIFGKDSGPPGRSWTPIYAWDARDVHRMINWGCRMIILHPQRLGSIYWTPASTWWT